MSDKRLCPKCGLATNFREGDGACPVYHGRTGDGFCPLFVDGETALQVATRFHDWWLSESQEKTKLQRAAYARPRWVRWLWP